jgi:hypothetical protein
VSRLVGLPEEGREQMLDWARANFNCFGPMNARTEQSLPVLQDAIAYSTDPTLRERLRVRRFEVSAAEPLMNNVLHGPRTLQVTVT